MDSGGRIIPARAGAGPDGRQVAVEQFTVAPTYELEIVEPDTQPDWRTRLRELLADGYGFAGVLQATAARGAVLCLTRPNGVRRIPL